MRLRTAALVSSLLLIGATIATHLQVPGRGTQAANRLAAKEHLLDELDDCLHKRFGTFVDFGVRRMVKADERTHRLMPQFRTENEAEQKALAALEQAGYQVALFVVGRDVAGATPDSKLWAQGGMFERRRPVSHPVFITAQLDRDKLPKPWELWEEAQEAFSVFADDDRYDFTHGQWRISARPVRATQETCLACHKNPQPVNTRLINISATGKEKEVKPAIVPLKIGDPVGALVYAYKSAR